ncbi:MAG: glycosyltransferase family 4 protein [Actinobacteria bacterium]|nr:glycosyltransferase family 4 protein [Actinomycetota bacterium]
MNDSWLRDVSKVEKVLFITNDFGPRAGGIETFLMGLIERQKRDSVIVYTSSQGDTRQYDAAWKSDFGVEVIRDRTRILLPTPFVARKVRKVVQERQIKRACFGAAVPLGLLAPSLSRAGVQRILALTHGHEVWWARIFPFSWALRRVGKFIDVMTYLGDFTQSAIAPTLTAHARAAMVRIAPGIDTSHFSPSADSREIRSSLGLTDKKVIVSVGRLVHRKGQDFLIRALPIIRQSIPNVHLLLIGEGPYRQKLESLAKECNVEDAITFKGRIKYEELPRYISAGDIFAMPSRSRFNGLEVEGLGIVYLEASACGLPVVAGNSGGAPDAVLEGETGFVVDGVNTSAIAQACVKLLENPQLAIAMGIAGREWIERDWSWDLWANEFSKALLAK